MMGAKHFASKIIVINVEFNVASEKLVKFTFSKNMFPSGFYLGYLGEHFRGWAWVVLQYCTCELFGSDSWFVSSKKPQASRFECLDFPFSNPTWQWKMDLLMYFLLKNGWFCTLPGKSSDSQSRGERFAVKVAAKSWGDPMTFWGIWDAFVLKACWPYGKNQGDQEGFKVFFWSMSSFHCFHWTLQFLGLKFIVAHFDVFQVKRGAAFSSKLGRAIPKYFPVT